MTGRRSRQARPGRVRPLTLADLSPGQTAEIVSVEANDPAGYRRLFALGLVPGARLKLIRRRPVFVIAVGHTVVAVDAAMASGVAVCP